MDERLVQIARHTGENYLPVVRFGAWRVALLNTHPRFYRENLTLLERHNNTDETFTLLCGSAVLYIGDGGGEAAGRIEALRLEPCTVYNVRRGVWHAIQTAAHTSVLITENDDTCQANTEKLGIDPDALPPCPPLGGN